MLGYHEPAFECPGFDGSLGWCEVQVFWDLQGECLVLIRDHDDHGSTSVTNRIAEIGGLVQTRVLNSLGVPLENTTAPASRGNTHWVTWSAVDRVYAG